MAYKLYDLTDEEIAIVEGHNEANRRNNRRPRRLANKIRGAGDICQ